MAFDKKCPFDDLVEEIDGVLQKDGDSHFKRMLAQSEKEALLYPKTVELSEEDAVKYFGELYRAFREFLRDLNVLKNNEYKKTHQETINSMNRGNFNDDSIFDYYFEQDGKKYTMDIYDNPDEFAFEPGFFNFSEDVVICDIYQYIDSYSTANIKLGATIAYDKKQNKLANLCGIEIIDNTNYDGLIQFVLYMLDSAGFLEHGSGIWGAWLTDLGRMFLYVLNNSDLDIN